MLESLQSVHAHACTVQIVFLRVDVVVAAAVDNRQQVLEVTAVMCQDEQVVPGVALGLLAETEFQLPVVA